MRDLLKELSVLTIIASVIVSLALFVVGACPHKQPAAPVCEECNCGTPGAWCCCGGKCRPKCSCEVCPCPLR